MGRSKTESLNKYKTIHDYIKENPSTTIKQISLDLGIDYSWVSRQVSAMFNQQSVKIEIKNGIKRITENVYN